MKCHSFSKPGGCKSPNPEPDSSLKQLVSWYQRYCGPSLRDQLDDFRQLPALADAIDRAAWAVNAQGKRFPHQYRIQGTALELRAHRTTSVPMLPSVEIPTSELNTADAHQLGESI